MTLDQLRYFLEAANFQHVGRAARSIFISPSAISNAIAALEKEMNCRLFERKSRRIQLTAQGEKLRKRAEGLLEEIQDIGDEMHGRRQGLQGKFRLAASHFLSGRLLAAAWTELQNRHPKLSGEIFSMDTAFMLSEILAGRVQCGLGFSPLKHPELDDTVIHRGQLCIAVGKKHPSLRLPEDQRLKELSKYPATLHKAAQGVDICETHPMYDKFGIRPRIDLFFDNDDTAITRLTNSHAWSLLPDIVIQSTKGAIETLASPRGWSAPYHISTVARRQHSRDPVLVALTSQLRSELSRFRN